MIALVAKKTTGGRRRRWCAAKNEMRWENLFPVSKHFLSQRTKLWPFHLCHMLILLFITLFLVVGTIIRSSHHSSTKELQQRNPLFQKPFKIVPWRSQCLVASCLLGTLRSEFKSTNSGRTLRSLDGWTRSSSDKALDSSLSTDPGERRVDCELASWLYHRDASKAVEDMNGQNYAGERLRVELSRWSLSSLTGRGNLI